MTWSDFTSWMSGAMKTVGGAISHAATGVANFASATLDKVIGAGEHVVDKYAEVYQTGMKTLGSTVNSLGGDVKDLGSNLGNAAGGAIDGLGKSLSMPLAIGAAGVVIFMLMNNKPK
jgi:hypothetical protein